MSWRQPSTGKLTDPDPSISDITKIRLENTRLRLELQNMKKEVQPRNDEINKLLKEVMEMREREGKVRNQLVRMGIGLGLYGGEVGVGDVWEGLDVLEKKIVEVKEKLMATERELERSKSLGETGQAGLEKLQSKQRQLELTLRRLDLKEQQTHQLHTKLTTVQSHLQALTSQTSKKDNLLAQLSHRLTQLEIQKKDLEAEMKSINVNINMKNGNGNDNRSEQIKKQCEELLQQVQIRDDDYLRSYLLKNQRFHNRDSISRRNKYDFIFQQ